MVIITYDFDPSTLQLGANVTKYISNNYRPIPLHYMAL